jgi:transposase, IS6 family
VRYRLSYADVAELLAERGVMVSRSTVYRWVQRFLPLFAEAARAYCQPVGGKWRVDETYCRLDGRWAYCYRAIDEDGQVVEAYCIASGATPRRHRPSLSELLRRWLSRPSVSSPTGRGATRPHYGRSCRASSIGARDT